MTTILERPYLMKKPTSGNEIDDYYDYDVSNDQYEGYCKDLADELSRLTRASFEIRPVRDGRYGSIDPDAQGDYKQMIEFTFHIMKRQHTWTS